MFRFLFVSLFFFFSPLSVLAATITPGPLNLDAFSWGFSAKDEVTILTASASIPINPGGVYCTASNSKSCGIAFGVGLASGATIFHIYTQGDSSSFTNTLAKSIINSLSGKVFSINELGVPNQGSVKYLCLYKYQKTSTATSYDFINPACNGGHVPPTPVPAKCNLSLDNAVVDFGDISATAFSNAGASHIPDRMPKQSRTVTVSCTTRQSTMAYMRLSTTKAVSDMIVSDNSDVGFIVEHNGSRVVPNNASSTIPVTLNEQGEANVVLNTATVSVTGKKPRAGVYSATALLTVAWQ